MVILIDRRHKNVHHQLILIIHGHGFILHTQSTFNPPDIDDYTYWRLITYLIIVIIFKAMKDLQKRNKIR